MNTSPTVNNPNAVLWSHLSPMKNKCSGKCSKMCWIVGLMVVSMVLIAFTSTLVTFFITTKVVVSQQSCPNPYDTFNDIDNLLDNNNNDEDSYYSNPVTRFNNLFAAMSKNEKCVSRHEQPNQLTNAQKVQKLNDFGWMSIGQLLNDSCIHKKYGSNSDYTMDQYCMKSVLSRIITGDINQSDVAEDTDMESNVDEDQYETSEETTTAPNSYDDDIEAKDDYEDEDDEEKKDYYDGENDGDMGETYTTTTTLRTSTEDYYDSDE